MRNRHLYPVNWEEISLSVRQRANWQCQCCGKQCRQSGESVQNFIDRVGLPADEVKLAPIRWCLTVAHLNHEPSDCGLENLKAMCAPCHLRYDVDQHIQTRKANRRKALEANGQLLLFTESTD